VRNANDHGLDPIDLGRPQDTLSRPVGMRVLKQSMSLRLSTAWLLPFTWLYSIDTSSEAIGPLLTPRLSLLVVIMNPVFSRL